VERAGTADDGRRWSDTTVDVAGTPVLVQRSGEGPPLLFLHAEGVTWRWGAVHEGLARHFDVVAPVHPGFGGSELPDWLGGMDDVAFHYVDLLDEVGLGRPIVVGASLGGWMAFQLAAQRPDRVAALLLVGALGLRSEEPMPDLFIRPGPEALGYLSARLDATAVDPLEGDADAATELWLDQAAQARLTWERPYDPRWTRRAHHVRCPVRLLWGGADRLLPPEHGARMATGLGAPAPAVVPGAGHLVGVDDPAAVVDAARDLAATLQTEVR
jgi:pimeloyl-ACP methyl ester carboxylesterase